MNLLSWERKRRIKSSYDGFKERLFESFGKDRKPFWFVIPTRGDRVMHRIKSGVLKGLDLEIGINTIGTGIKERGAYRIINTIFICM